jgi:hypothetical protein
MKGLNVERYVPLWIEQDPTKEYQRLHDQQEESDGRRVPVVKLAAQWLNRSLVLDQRINPNVDYRRLPKRPRAALAQFLFDAGYEGLSEVAFVKSRDVPVSSAARDSNTVRSVRV